MNHPRHQLDELIHTPVRFSLMAALAAGGEVEFRALRDSLEVSDSLLSQHVRTLERAGYVQVQKGHVGKRPRTWLSLTAVGNQSFRAHYRTLQAIAADQAPAPAADEPE